MSYLWRFQKMSFYKNIQSFKPHIIDKHEEIPVGELRLYKGINCKGEKLQLVYQCVDIAQRNPNTSTVCEGCVMVRIDKFLHPDYCPGSNDNCKRCLAQERSDARDVTFVEYELL